MFSSMMASDTSYHTAQTVGTLTGGDQPSATPSMQACSATVSRRPRIVWPDSAADQPTRGVVSFASGHRNVPAIRAHGYTIAPAAPPDWHALRSRVAATVRNYHSLRLSHHLTAVPVLRRRHIPNMRECGVCYDYSEHWQCGVCNDLMCEEHVEECQYCEVVLCRNHIYQFAHDCIHAQDDFVWTGWGPPLPTDSDSE